MTYPTDPDDPYGQPRFIPSMTAPPPPRPTAAQPAVPPPPSPRRKRHWLRNSVLAALTFIVVLVVVLVARGGLSVSRLTGHAAAPPSCHQQYMTWKTGPAKAEADKLKPALATVQSASNSDDIPLMQSGLEQAGAVARQLETYPIPACADPAGYWQQILADIRASGDNAGSAGGLAGLIAAEVPLKNVPALETKLAAEFKTTAQIGS